MPPFSIAVAQSTSSRGDVARNVARHLAFTGRAIEAGASLVVFPELSLTGYEPDLAAGLVLDGLEQVLSPLREAAVRGGIVVVAGAPIRSDTDRPYIGALAFRPDGTVAPYRKRHLHPGEERYFTGSTDAVVLEVAAHRVGMAICADIDHPQHAATAHRLGAVVYAAGVFMTPTGIDQALARMSARAAARRMLAAMANHAGPGGGFESGGRSAVWSPSGELLAEAPARGPALLVAREGPAGWRAEPVSLAGAADA